MLKYALQETKKVDVPQNTLVIASHFFNGRGAEIQKVPLGLFRSLLHQLLEKVPYILSELVENFEAKLKTQGEPGKDWNWHSLELQTLLARSLLKVGKVYTIRIFVDALDECGEDAAVDLVDYFQRLLSASNADGGTLSICFSCRHYPIMTLDSGFEICVEDENREDIETYIQDKLQSIRDPVKISILQEQITARASGSFQWVTLVVPRVCQLHRKAKPLQIIQSDIQKIPAELNSLYRELLQSIEEESVSQSLHIMQWISFATRPLTLDELRHALAVDADTPYKSFSECRNSPEYADTQEEMERRLKDLCRGLAEIKEHENGRVVQFIHQSVNDFLLQEGLRILDNSSGSTDQAIGRAHLRISGSCIKYIAMEEVGCWVEQMKQGTSKSKDVPVEILLLRYAATELFSHVEMVGTTEMPHRALLNFFQWPSNQILQRWKDISNITRPYSREHRLKGASLLQVASYFGLLSLLKELLEIGVDLEAKDSNYARTPLSFAAKNGHEAIIKLLLEKGVDVEAEDVGGRTPLSRAVENGNKAVVKLLLENGVNIEAKDGRGRTPLWFAACYGRKAVIKLLLKKGAKADTCKATLLVAKFRGHKRVVKLLKKLMSS